MQLNAFFYSNSFIVFFHSAQDSMARTSGWEKTNECGKTYIARDRDNYLFHNEFSHQYEFRVSRASALSVLRMGVPQSRRHQASKDTEDTGATEVSCI